MKPTIIATGECLAPPVEVPKPYASQLRRADDFIKLAVSTADKVLAGHTDDLGNGNRTGLFIGTAFGPMQTNFDVLGLIVDEEQTSPTLFSHSVFNSAAGYIARLFNIPGSCFTYTDFSWPFFRALAEGYGALATGRLDRCLVLQVESYSDLLADARERTETSAASWPPGAVCWYLAAEGKGTGWQLEEVSVDKLPAASSSYIQRREELHSGKGADICTTPLDAAATLTRLLRTSTPEAELHCKLTAPYGSVMLTFHPKSE